MAVHDTTPPVQTNEQPKPSGKKKQTKDNHINMDELAEHVFALLKRELLIERERLGRR
jgi:hypothetical protein